MFPPWRWRHRVSSCRHRVKPPLTHSLARSLTALTHSLTHSLARDLFTCPVASESLNKTPDFIWLFRIDETIVSPWIKYINYYPFIFAACVITWFWWCSSWCWVISRCMSGMAVYSASKGSVDLAIDPLIMCKLCLTECALKDMYELHDCKCLYCRSVSVTKCMSTLHGGLTHTPHTH